MTPSFQRQINKKLITLHTFICRFFFLSVVVLATTPCLPRQMLSYSHNTSGTTTSAERPQTDPLGAVSLTVSTSTYRKEAATTMITWQSCSQHIAAGAKRYISLPLRSAPTQICTLGRHFLPDYLTMSGCNFTITRHTSIWLATFYNSRPHGLLGLATLRQRKFS